MSQIGRISGPLLKANLIRDGVDLAFETDLLYMDVTNRRIGINKSSPQYDLDVDGTVRTGNLTVENQFTIGDFTITGNTISSAQNTINFVASGGDTTAYHSRMSVDDIEILNNTISTTVSNSNLELRANGTGIIDIQTSTSITGNLQVSGNISAGGNVVIAGNITIGDALSDTVTINASITSDLIPQNNNTYDLGSSTNRWKNLYATTIVADTLDLNSFTIGNITLTDSTISTTSGTNLNLVANGTGAIRIGNFAISSNTITNVSSGAVTNIEQSGTGYFKVSGTNGMVFPRGNTSERPTAYAVEGMTRYNTDSRALEIWDGTQWASPAGSIGAVSESTATDIAIKFALTLG